MRWEDERFVKVYTRETVTTMRLEWQGRAVLAELFKKVDRAGLLEIGDEDPVEALAGMLRMPEEVVSVGWEKLISGKDPVVTIRDGSSRAIFIPNFMPAQEANQSDVARKQKSREVARARHLVTHCDNVSRNGTESHTRSHAVTPRLDETRVDVPNSQESLAAPISEPWPEETLKRLRSAFMLTGLDAVRNTKKANDFERMRIVSLRFPIAQRLAAAESFLASGRGEKENPAYLLTMIENGAAPRAQAPPRGAAFNPRIDPNAHATPGRKRI